MTKMNAEVKARWVAALRSGEYQQIKGQLKCDGGFCCLGVLSEICVKETGKGEWEYAPYDSPGETFVGTDGMSEVAILHLEVQKWADLPDANPDVLTGEDEGDMASLAELNDSGHTFTEIADLIEQQL